MMQSRYYQDEAFSSVIREFEDVNRTLLIMATGTGKTVVFSRLARWYIDRYYSNVLIVAHRQRLLTQAHATLLRFGFSEFEIGYEMADRTAIGSDLCRVVLASKDSLHEKRLKRYNPLRYGLVIIDEAHHSVAKTYKSVIEHFTGAKVLGVTATPDRMDKKNLGEIFQSVAYQYDISAGIRDGFLVDISAGSKRIPDGDINIDDVKIVKGDLSSVDLERILVEEKNLHVVAKGTLDYNQGRPTLVSCATIHHAEELERTFNAYKFNVARAIHGKLPKDAQQRILSDFEEGKFSILLNCLLLTEGVDIPIISCIAMARPTKSRALYAQFIGRGTRLLNGASNVDESSYMGKADCLILDFVGSTRHKLITPSNFLAGDVGDTDEERDKFERMVMDIRKRFPHIDSVEAISVAKRQTQAQIVAEKVRLSVGDISPFDLLGINIASPKYIMRDGDRMTDKQRELLERSGIQKAVLDVISKGQASDLIDGIIARRRDGRASYKQVKRLAVYGINANSMSYADASRLMSVAADYGWRNSPTLRAALESHLDITSDAQ